MAEIVGTTVGVVGLLGQLFSGCVKAYGLFHTATQMDTESQKLLCKVRIEEMRLVVWGQEWGVAEGMFDAHLGSSSSKGGSNAQLRALATQILEGLHATVTDVRKLKDRYGLVDGGGGGGDGTGEDDGKEEHGISVVVSSSSGNGSDKSRIKPKGFKSERGWRKDLAMRSKWVIGDKDKFNSLLTDLKDFNDGLERLFPPSQLLSFQRSWTHQLLQSAQRDVSQLSLLESASTDIYPRLNKTANLKKLRINLDAVNPHHHQSSSFKPTYNLKVPLQSLSIPGDENDKNNLHNGSKTTSSTNAATTTRCTAHHQSSGHVLIEWIEYDPSDIETRVAHLRRLDNLARMIHSSSSSHPDLHSIDCLGHTDDPARSRYGLIYRSPSPSFSTLHALISSPDLKTPDLDDRINLARTLSVALWSLHSLDWLHKSLCASNILFFPSAFSTSAQAPTEAGALVPDISTPYLVGFDASRPDLDAGLSVIPKNPSIADLHRHPSSLRGLPHCKAFDVYSLGLILLEIGLWKVLENFYKGRYTPSRWRDKVLLNVLAPTLGSKVGKRYREVVEMCLGVEEGLSNSEAGELMASVVTKLEAIRL